jgi:hypothetical protein
VNLIPFPNDGCLLTTSPLASAPERERSCPPYLTIHFGRVGGVVLSKVIAVLLMLGVRRRLWMVNLVYIGVICWNVVVVVALAVRRH